MKATKAILAKDLQYGDVLCAKQLDDLRQIASQSSLSDLEYLTEGTDFNWSMQDGNDHLMVVGIQFLPSDEVTLLEIRYATGNGTGRFRIGADVTVFTYAN